MAYSKRILKICELAGTGKNVADIGCDHGYVTIELLRSGAYKRALAMDVNEGPLNTASINAKAAGVFNKIDFRLSDGFSAFSDGDAETVVICGMGGILIKNIITAGMDRLRSVNRLVLGPQSEIAEFRYFLVNNNLCIERDTFIHDEGKDYQLIVASFNEGIATDRYNKPEFLHFGYEPLISKNEELKTYLLKASKVNEDILEKLESKLNSDDSNIPVIKRVNELRENQRIIKTALEYYK